MAKEITDQNFKETVIESKQPVLLDFWAAWCGPCRMIAPAVEELSEEYDGKAVIGKVDVDQNPELSMQFGIRSIPTLLFVKDGKVVDKVVGVQSKVALAQRLDALLGTEVA